jgi:hypothetical protein
MDIMNFNLRRGQFKKEEEDGFLSLFFCLSTTKIKVLIIFIFFYLPLFNTIAPRIILRYKKYRTLTPSPLHPHPKVTPMTSNIFLAPRIFRYFRDSGGRYSVVGIANCYDLGGQGIESPGERFGVPHTGPEDHLASCAMGTGSLSQGKAAGAWC